MIRKIYEYTFETQVELRSLFLFRCPLLLYTRRICV